MTTVAACRANLIASLASIAERTEPSKRVIILSGGVDTCAILAASKEAGVTFAAAITVVTGEKSPDKEFAIAAAAEHSLPHHIVHVTSADLIDTYLPSCVRILHTFDGMTLRNSLVVAAAMRKTAELGFFQAVVGDGADELFGGYSFMWGSGDDTDEWKRKRDKLCSEWTFATSALAASYGLTSHSPYTEQRFVDWAIANTAREDCIGTHPIRLVLRGEAVEHQTGKVVLRRAFDTISSWRRKDPIEIGSGITVIGHDPFWADILSDEEFAKDQAEAGTRGFVISNKEHLVNFRAFEATFGRDGAGLGTKPRLWLFRAVFGLFRAVSRGAWVRAPKSKSKLKRLGHGFGCAGCCFEIAEATFCQICGAYPAQRS